MSPGLVFSFVTSFILLSCSGCLEVHENESPVTCSIRLFPFLRPSESWPVQLCFRSQQCLLFLCCSRCPGHAGGPCPRCPGGHRASGGHCASGVGGLAREAEPAPEACLLTRPALPLTRVLTRSAGIGVPCRVVALCVENCLSAW